VRAEAYTKAARKGRICGITRPKLLLVVGHPSIGAALETLLRMEDRYEVRRVQSPDQARTDVWTADLALVDGVLLDGGRMETLVIPTIVLTGSPSEGTRLAARLAEGRGWLRKDATADELRATIDRVLRSRSGLQRRRVVLAAAASATLLFLAVLTVAVMLLIRRG
jgi:DNA-binding response OmpR family regulator